MNFMVIRLDDIVLGVREGGLEEDRLALRDAMVRSAANTLWSFDRVCLKGMFRGRACK